MSHAQDRKGLVFALTAYITWGMAPIYFKFLVSISSVEVIAHRIVWSVFFLLLVLVITKQLSQLKQLLAKLNWLVVSALLVSGNWLLFVWAVSQGRISETSLGYYINPLVSVVLASVFLGETLRPLQRLAFLVASIGVAVRLFHYGAIPWVAIVLALSFGCYGLVRKKVAVPAVAGLTMETLLLLPIALLFLLFANSNGTLSFLHGPISVDLLLVFAGVVTSVPLLCFAAAVVRLNLITIGMLQYIAPSLSLFLAVWVYGEPFTLIDLISFACIWIALIIFTVDSIRSLRIYRAS